MPKSIKQVALPVDTATSPVIVESIDNVIDVLSTERRRPVVAINNDGQLTVCCRRTARKHGWEIQGALFQRTRSGKRSEAQAKATKLALDLQTGNLITKPAAKKAANQPQRRKADQPAEVERTASHVASAVHDALVESLLAAGKMED